MINKYLDEEPEQIKTINEMSDPEEINAALELLEERISEPEESETSQQEQAPSNEGTATEEEQGKESSGEEFIITDDFISSQDEESKKILSKYLNKGKEDIVKAISHAIAFKTPYLKGKTEIIKAIENEYSKMPAEELVKILVETQKQVGYSTTKQPKGTKEEQIQQPALKSYKEIQLDLKDPEINKMIEKQVIGLLREKYPGMPDVESLQDEEYKEWRRELLLDDVDNNFAEDLKNAKATVENEIKKYIYIKDNLKNLYDDSPNELYQRIKDAPDDIIANLKRLNDNPVEVFYEDIKEEVNEIRNWLKNKYGLTEKDLNLDLNIKLNEKGLPSNKILFDLITIQNGTQRVFDPEVIARHSKVFFLRNKNVLRDKFIKEYEPLILKAYVEKMINSDKKYREKLKNETLKEGSTTGSSYNQKTYTLEDINDIDDPKILEQIIKSVKI